MLDIDIQAWSRASSYKRQNKLCIIIPHSALDKKQNAKIETIEHFYLIEYWFVPLCCCLPEIATLFTYPLLLLMSPEY